MVRKEEQPDRGLKINNLDMLVCVCVCKPLTFRGTGSHVGRGSGLRFVVFLLAATGCLIRTAVKKQLSAEVATC